eukprot:TRINITY_DN4131_c0_g1_i2.p1 TRINITY_DN4131_c0_g1~~TRINITY_DN4131_c0_g1_i2.p1  ORF type:complete len:153 (+),score=8.55 TRINITY_DN4131_c0_g1_i2:215-673(+)
MSTEDKPTKGSPSLTVDFQTVWTEGSSNEVDVLCTVTPAEGRRLPVDLVAVVDTSGSMAVDAAIRDESGNETSTGFTNLSIVKHSLKTILHGLTPRDRFALVEYNSNVRILCKEFSLVDRRAQGHWSLVVCLSRAFPACARCTARSRMTMRA